MTRHCSIILCTAVAALVALGLIMLTSTGAWVKGFGPYHFLCRQAWMVGIGLVAALVAARIPMEFFRKLVPWMFGGAVLLLVLCFVPGIADPQYGSNRWIKVPLIGQFQPSEAAKIVIVLAISAWFARWQTEVRTFWRGFVVPGLIAGIPIVLIAGETDVGTALSLSVAVGAILFCVGTRLLYALPSALAVVSGAAFYIYNNPNRWGRIEAWLDLENPVHQLDRGMQQWRALLALGNGGPWGVGLGNGVEKFGTLTFAHIDFIFPVIGEELGFVGVATVIVLYFWLTRRVFHIGRQAIALDRVFAGLMCQGIGIWIGFQAFINMGVNLGVLPTKGLTLPLMSFGGSAILMNLVALALVLRADIENRALMRGGRS